MEVIRILTVSVIQVIEFKPSTVEAGTKFLQDLLGKDCFIEHVRPKRLYSDFGMKNDISMLVDEDGLAKGLPINLLGSWLYETDKHGAPIVGHALIVGEKLVDGDRVFCGLSQDIIGKLINQFTKLPEKMKFKEVIR